MIDHSLPCSCCYKSVIDFQSVSRGKYIICEGCIRKPFMKGKSKKQVYRYCVFHRKWEKAFYTSIKVRFLYFFRRKIYICSNGWSELFANCRKEM